MPFCCPVCHAPLTLLQNSLVCKNEHCFDRAKSGYVNLLLSSHKHSKEPGDNKQMVSSRNAFLQKGYYAPLLEALCQKVTEFSVERKSVSLLDAGCGEGYYTAGMAEALNKSRTPFDGMGIDVSKAAVDLAAKRKTLFSFAVASVFSIPVLDASCDIVTELFAPFCRDEYHRVLKSNGIFLMVIPNTAHLWELKQAVYDHPYLNEVKSCEIPGFTLLSKTPVDDTLVLKNQEDIQSLFYMTPYAYKTSKEDVGRLCALTSLTTQISFLILCYRKDK